MMVAQLLDPSQRDQYKILKLILETNQEELTNRQFREQTGESEFRFKRMCQELNASWQQHFEHQLIFEKTPGSELLQWQISPKEGSLFIYELINQSATFKLLDALFKEEFTVEGFAKSHFLSTSSVYKTKRTVETLLKKYDLKIENSRLAGRERNIRNLMLDIYTSNYEFITDLSQSCPDFYILVKLNIQVTMYYQLSLSPSQRQKLMCFYYVMYLRIHAGKIIDKPESIFKEESIADLRRYFCKYYSLSVADAEAEVKYLVFFLYAQSFIQSYIFRPSKVKAQIDRLTKAFLVSVVQKILPGKVVANDEIVKLIDQVDKINLRYVIFDGYGETDISDEQLSDLAILYPQYHQLVTSFIAGQPDLKSIVHHWDLSLKLYYDYMFLLLRYLPVAKIEQPVYICVDFTRGYLYTQYIAKSIQKYKNLNIIIQVRINNQTDIYLSDIMLHNFAGRQILWRNPPLSKDWWTFGIIVNEVRQEKRTLVKK